MIRGFTLRRAVAGLRGSPAPSLLFQQRNNAAPMAHGSGAVHCGPQYSAASLSTVTASGTVVQRRFFSELSALDLRLLAWHSARRHGASPTDDEIASVMALISSTSSVQGHEAFRQATALLRAEDAAKYAPFIAALEAMVAQLPSEVTPSKDESYYIRFLSLVDEKKDLLKLYKFDQPLTHPLAVLAALCSGGSPAVDSVVAAMTKARDADKASFEADFATLRSCVLPHPCMVDVGLDLGVAEAKAAAKRSKSRETQFNPLPTEPEMEPMSTISPSFEHPFFARLRGMNMVASRPLGDLRTAAYSLPSKAAVDVQLFLQRFLLGRPKAELDALLSGADMPVVVVGVDNAAVLRLPFEDYPALQYLYLAAPLQDSGAVAEPGLRRDFDTLAQTAGVREHLEALVRYGQSVARWLLTAVPSKIEDVGPEFKHRLTANLEMPTGLRTAYTADVEAQQQQLAAATGGALSLSPDACDTNPIHVIMSCRPMGKSHALQRLAQTTPNAVCIGSSFGSLVAEDVATTRTRFYSRLLQACVFPLGTVCSCSVLVNTVGMNPASFVRVLERLGVPIPSLICMDEFPRVFNDVKRALGDEPLAEFARSVTALSAWGVKLVFSGLASTDAETVRTASGRPVQPYFLQPLCPGAKELEDFRIRFGPLRAAVMRTLDWSANGVTNFHDSPAVFPDEAMIDSSGDALLMPLLYYACQSSTGVLGHIFYDGRLPASFRHLRYIAYTEADKVARWRRQLLLDELKGATDNAAKHEEAQRADLALPLSESRVVVNPFSFFVTVCGAAQKNHTDPFERHLVDLVRRLSRLARRVEAKTNELYSMTAANASHGDQHAVASDIERTKHDFVATATYYARALLVFDGDRPYDLDPDCTLFVAVDRTSASEKQQRAKKTAVRARLLDLETRKVSRFVWRVAQPVDAVACVVEGEHTARGWKLRLTRTASDAAANRTQVEQFAESLKVAPCPFGVATRVASVELVLLCPGAAPGEKTALDERLAESLKGKRLVAHGKAVRVVLKCEAAEVRGFITTPIAAVLPL